MSEHLPECPKGGCPACYSGGYSAAMDDGWGEPGHIKQAVAEALTAAREIVNLSDSLDEAKSRIDALRGESNA